MANVLTTCRILFCIIILFIPIFTKEFYCLYILAGITDIFDGIIARKFKLVSKFGTIFDTVADIFFVAVTLVKVFPLIELSSWIKIWFIIIVLIKFINILLGFVLYKRMVAQHTILNKITGILLFIFPIILSVSDYRYIVILLCCLASISAIQEGYYIKMGKIIE